MLQQQRQWWLSCEPLLALRLQEAIDTMPLAQPLSVDTLMIEALKFMHLAAHQDEILTPSKVVDEAWHQMILFTRSYQAFCQQYYGQFLHHQPGGTEAENLAQLDRTLYLLQLQFGPLNPICWPSRRVLDISGACSSCATGTG